LDSLDYDRAVQTLGPQFYNKDTKVAYTYIVRFKESDLMWAHRFDHYMKLGNGSNTVHIV